MTDVNNNTNGRKSANHEEDMAVLSPVPSPSYVFLY